MTSVEPTHPYCKVQIGVVLRQHAVEGSVLVAIRRIPLRVSEWQSYTCNVSATDNPTLVQPIDACYKVLGKSCNVKLVYASLESVGAAGTGVYEFTLPAGLSIDTALMQVATGLAYSETLAYPGYTAGHLGQGIIANVDGLTNCFAVPTSSTTFALIADGNPVCSDSFSFADQKLMIRIELNIPLA
jgi:hypothetical protein